jgi:hypothetical protein
MIKATQAQRVDWLNILGLLTFILLKKNQI